MTFKPIFGQITILSLSFVTFRVSRFRVSHLTHETVKLCLQNTLNMSKTTRVYFGVLQCPSFQLVPINTSNSNTTSPSPSLPNHSATPWQPRAHYASNTPSTTSWILDSGASHHVTADLNNLSLHAQNTGSDGIMIGYR